MNVGKMYKISHVYTSCWRSAEGREDLPGLGFIFNYAVYKLDRFDHDGVEKRYSSTKESITDYGEKEENEEYNRRHKAMDVWLG